VVWHLSIPLMNIFYETEAAIVPLQIKIVFAHAGTQTWRVQLIKYFQTLLPKPLKSILKPILTFTNVHVHVFKGDIKFI